MLTSHAKRVEQANAMGAKVLGMEELVSQSGDDDMGNIIVTGDINLAPGTDVSALPWTQAQPTAPSAPSSAAPSPSAAAQSPTAQPDSTAGSLAPWIKSAAVVAASALGGGAIVPIGGAILDWMTSDPPAVVQPAEPTAQPGLQSGGVKIEPFQVQP